MKFLLMIALATVASFAAATSIQCNRGPTFWCSNLSNAKLCGAVRHCIQTVWEKEEVEKDNDSVCQICLDMVKQARDQLESNQTISDLKDVFEGSCKLIPLKPIQKECIKMADDFIPELVEALASQMNPQMVCSVAGLCNNAAIDKMLADQKQIKVKYVGSSLTCNNCNALSNTILDKFNQTNKDVILENVLSICGEMSSFSDACNSIILTYFNTFYEQVQAKLSTEAVCHISGVCSFKYHSHNDQEQETKEDAINVKDDLPCELCEQLVKHLRDVLVANTTEDEFKQVLQGLCGQTKGFKTECMSLVDEYYKLIYETLVNNLDANGACFLIGICPKGNNVILKQLPPADVKITIKKLELEPNALSNREIVSMQKNVNKPMETELSNQLVENGELCTLCEYFMHFVQETLTLPANEETIKTKLKLICSKSMPKSLKGECDDFVEMYSDAVIALLIQEIDPRQICPMVRMCPQAPEPVTKENTFEDKPTCPLCLFAVEQAQIQIKDDKTKENAKKVLNNLCNHFPNNKLKAECVDFVDTYTSELINMLVQDFTPQQICVSIKLCASQGFDLSTMNIEIEDKDFEMKEDDFVESPQCMLCKKVVEMVEKEIIGDKTKDNIINALKKSCSKMKKTAQKECQKFVDKYGDLLAELLLKETKPEQVCKDLMYCSVQREDIFREEKDDTIASDAPPCAVCEIIMMQMEQELKNNKTMDEIESALQNICHNIPSNLSDKCSKIISQYSEVIIKLIVSTPPKEICRKINLCSGKIIENTKVEDTPPCMICEIIMLQLEQELKNNKTKDEVKTFLLNICHKVPSKLSSQCSKIIEQYSYQILNFLDVLPPKAICQKINLCSNIDISGEILDCGICQGISSFLVSQKNANLTNDEIKELSCDSFPPNYFEKCTEMVNYYAISIQNMIQENFDENAICAKIGKCVDNEGNHSFQIVMDGHKTKRTLVGDNECTYGPSHWCSSKEVAKKCDLMDYCEKVWKSKKD